MGRTSARSIRREHIAHLAARLMAEDGIEDHAVAKRKAARQAGADDRSHLPDNEEIDAALKTYRELYQPHHTGQLRELRERALDLMTEFARFSPYLTGSVLNGTAGNFADIHLQLYTEPHKTVELELLNKGIRYQSRVVRLYIGDMLVDSAVLSFDRDAVTVHLTLLTPRELRSRIKTNQSGRPIERADRAAVEQLLAGTNP
jgi:hypothetical protein